MTAVEILKKHNVGARKSKPKGSTIAKSWKKAEKKSEVAESAIGPARDYSDQTAGEKSPSLGNTGEKAGSRADLMAQAQNAGIKYFRILTKEELNTVLRMRGDGDQGGIDKVVDAAKKRWKKGWGEKGGPIAPEAVQKDPKSCA